MKVRNNLILGSRLNALVSLLDERIDIFFEERPYLEEFKKNCEITKSSRSYENNKKLIRLIEQIA